jgi:hypothetical protein
MLKVKFPFIFISLKFIQLILLGATSCSIRNSIMRVLRMGASWPMPSTRALEDVVESFADRGGSRRGVLPVLQVRIGGRNWRWRRRKILRII